MVCGVCGAGVRLRGRPLYLDMQATTPLDPRVLDAMMPHFLDQFGNPHSRTHAYGWQAEDAVEKARGQVASLISADPKEIVFTSGATESNNTAIKGVAHFYAKKKRHVITTQTEHKCVLDSCRHLQQEGFEVTYLPVQRNGLVDIAELEKAMRPDTVRRRAVWCGEGVRCIGVWSAPHTTGLAVCVRCWSCCMLHVACGVMRDACGFQLFLGKVLRARCVQRTLGCAQPCKMRGVRWAGCCALPSLYA